MLRVTARFLRNALRFLVRYPSLVRAWDEGYENLTSDSYWRGKLRMRAAAEDK